jgi:hypothetical protein
MEPEGLLPHSQVAATSPYPRLSVWIFRNKISFYGESSLAPRQTPTLEDHPLPAVCDCLFSIHSAIHTFYDCFFLITELERSIGQPTN